MQRWKEEAEGAKNRARRYALWQWLRRLLLQGRVERGAITAAIERARNALKKQTEAEHRNKQKAALRRTPIVERSYAAMPPVSARPSRS